MAIGVLGLVLLLLVLFGGGIVVVIALAMNAKTRPLALALIAVPVVLVALGVLAIIGTRFAVQHDVETARRQAQVQQINTFPRGISEDLTAPSVVFGKTFQHRPGCPNADMADAVQAASQAPAQATAPPAAQSDQEKAKPAEPKPPETSTQESSEPPASESESPTTDQAVTTFGKMLRALATAIDTELPKDLSETEAIDALERTVEEELPEGVDKSVFVQAVGKAVGKAIAARHSQLSESKPGSLSSTDVNPPAAAAKRPDWVGTPPRRLGQGLGVYQMNFTVGPYTTLMECERELPGQLHKALAEYVELYLGPEARGQIPLDVRSPIGVNHTALRDFVLKDVFDEEVTTSVGPMKQMHVRIELNQKFNEWLKFRWREVRVEKRIWCTGTGLCGLLGALAVAFFSMKIDLATEGRYRGRLAVLAVVLVTVLVFVVLGVLESTVKPQNVLGGTSVRMATAGRVMDLDTVAPADPRSVKVEVKHSELQFRHDWAMITPLGALLALGLVVLAAFKKTRPLALVLLAVVAVGLFLLIA